jgi:hypothetical protein
MRRIEIPHLTLEQPDSRPLHLCRELVEEHVQQNLVQPKWNKSNISAIDEHSVAPFIESVDRFAETLIAGISTYHPVIAGARADAQLEFLHGTYGIFYFVDVYKFAELVGERVIDETLKAPSLNVMDTLKTAVFVHATVTEKENVESKAFGLTISFPPNLQA